MSANVITFHYVLKDREGQLIDSSQGGDPVAYLEGSGQIIEGLEEALRDSAPGQKTEVDVPAEKAYGERDDTLVRRVSRTQLPVDEINVGDRFQTGADRHAPIVTVIGVEGDSVLLDANHPLAGVDLHFEVDVVDVREATPDEIHHGHAHGPGGHHH